MHRADSWLRPLQGLRNDSGQALVEASVVVATVCVMAFTLLQPALSLTVRMVIGYATGGLARAMTTPPRGGVDQAAVYKAYVRHKLAVLPQGPYMYYPDSLEVKISSPSPTGLCRVEVSLKQKPLPIVGALLARGGSDIVITESAEFYDGLAFSERTYDEKELIIEGK